MYRVLFHTDAMFLKSGLARCARENIVRFHEHPEFEVFQAGWHHIGIPHDFPVPIFPVVKMDPGEPERLYQIIQQIRPHFVVSIGDPFYFPWLRDLKAKIAKHIKHRCDWLGWITIDGDPLQAAQLSHILPFDRVMLMSRFSRRQVLNALDMAKEKHPSYKDLPEEDLTRLLDTHSVLYPGVNAQQFRPRSSTWNHPTLGPVNRQTKFVISVVDQNTSRKAIPIVIDAFADFRKGLSANGRQGKPRENVFLYLATDASDPHGTDLNEVARYQGLT